MNPFDARRDVPSALDHLMTATSPPKGACAVGVVRRDQGPPQVRASGTTRKRAWFELGSLTKTLTATLLAQQVLDGVVDLDRNVGSLLGPKAGNAAHVTLGELATHTSGLPRLPPNSITVPFWPRDPYRFYDERRLWRGLAKLEPKPSGTFSYSNLGFDLLGVCLATAADAPFSELLTESVMRPAGMVSARCQPCSSSGLLRGHGHWLMAGRRWHQPLSGAGGVDVTIEDLAAWASANLCPETTPLADAIWLAQRAHHIGDKTTVGLGWIHRGEIRWHNGATGGFHSMLAFDRSSAVYAIAAHSVTDDYGLEAPVIQHLEGQQPDTT